MDESSRAMRRLSSTAHRPEGVAETLRNAAAASGRSIRTARVVGLGALCALSVWLGWLHAEVAALDPERLAQLAEERGMDALSDAKVELAEHLRRSAPEVIGRGTKELLEAPTRLRGRIEAAADSWFDQTGAELEAELRERIAVDSEAVRRELDGRYPGLDDREKVRRLVRDVAARYRERVSALLLGPRDDYAGTLAGLEARILRLRREDGLTEREKVERDLLVTLVRLVRGTGTPEARAGRTIAAKPNLPDRDQ